MMSANTAKERWEAASSLVPDEQLLYRIRPAPGEAERTWPQAVHEALRKPIGALPLDDMLHGGERVVVLVDDLTRPTPQRALLRPVLNTLNDLGVPDERITVLIALGTHRYMTRAEMRERFGEEVCHRVNVFNHAWKDPQTFVELEQSIDGRPLKVNRMALEADFLMGLGSIVPHIYAGWGGGGKIVMPGIFSAEAIGPVHSLACAEGSVLEVAGRTGARCRQEIDRVAALVGLDYIVNVVVGTEGGAAWAGAGEPRQTHEAGVQAARRIFLRPIPRRAGIALVDARPADIEYWQGIKAAAHGARGVASGGTMILIGAFPEGIETTHPQFAQNALLSEEEILQGHESGHITDTVALTPLRLHALIRAHCHVICVSEGMSVEEKHALGFEHADSAEQALQMARERHEPSSPVGIIELGGDVLPEPQEHVT